MAKLSNAKSQFALDVAQQLTVMGKQVLTTHKLKPQIVKTILSRPDLCASLGVFVTNSKAYNKGAKALRRTKDFQILGYVGYQNFIKKASLDVSNFQNKVDGEFSLANNVNVIILQKDEATGNFESDVTDLKSLTTTWEKAILPAAKIPNAIYLVVLYGENWVRPKSEKFAAVKLRINVKKEAKRTPAKLKAELKRKANKKLKRINSQIRAAKSDLSGAQQRIKAFQKYGDVTTQQYLKNKKLQSEFTERLQAGEDKYSPEELEKFGKIARKSGRVATGTKLARSVRNQEALRDRVERLKSKLDKLTGRRQVINNDLAAKLAQFGDEELPQQQVAIQQLITQATPQQAANPRIQKLMKRAQLLNDRIANTTSSKVRGNANFELRKINSELQKLGVPSYVVNAEQLAPEMQIAPQATVAKQNTDRRVQKLMNRLEVLRKRLPEAPNSKVRGNIAYQIRNKKKQLLDTYGIEVPQQQTDSSLTPQQRAYPQQHIGKEIQQVVAAIAPQRYEQLKRQNDVKSVNVPVDADRQRIGKFLRLLTAGI